VKLPPRFFRAVLEGASKFIGVIERQFGPRWLWLTETVFLQRFAHGNCLCRRAATAAAVGGIPFTNTLPALVVVIGTLGVMERDGVAVAVAYGFSGDDGGLFYGLRRRDHRARSTGVALAGVLNEACVERFAALRAQGGA